MAEGFRPGGTRVRGFVFRNQPVCSLVAPRGHSLSPRITIGERAKKPAK